jgi:hypothetical protein
VKFKMCTCKWSSLVRPEGPIKITKTEVLSSKPGKDPDVLVARLSGAVSAKVAIVRDGNKFFFKGPKELGGTVAVPADSLTDCLNYKVWEQGEKIARKKGLQTGEKPRKRGGKLLPPPKD